MAEYRCFSCNKEVDPSYIKKRIRCPYCGGKMLFKERLRPTVVKAR